MGNVNPAISIIVPAYNAEKYISYCLDSILVQTFRDYEIIVRDDVSTDNTYEICQQKYAGLDCVTLIRNPVNKGQWYARNMGIKEAKGKYIFFMDDDDELLPEALEILYRTAEAEQAEVVHANFYAIVYSEERMLPRKSLWRHCRCRDIGEGLLTGTAAERLHYQGAMSMPMPWLNLYQRDFLLKEQIEFPPMVFGEDNIFAVDVALKAKRYVRINKAFYLYRSYFDQKGRMVGRFPNIFPYVQIFLKEWDRIFSSFSEEELPFGDRREFVSSWLMAHLKFGIFDIMNTDEKTSFAAMRKYLDPLYSAGDDFVIYLINMLEHTGGFRERIIAERQQKRENAKSFFADLKRGRGNSCGDYSYIYSEAKLAAYVEDGDDAFYHEAYGYWAEAALNLCKYQEALNVYEKSLGYVAGGSEEFWQTAAKRMAILPLTDCSSKDISIAYEVYEDSLAEIVPYTHDDCHSRSKKKLRLGLIFSGPGEDWFAMYYGVLFACDKDCFEIYCYHFGEKDGYTDFIRNGIARFVDASGCSCKEIASIIFSDEIDVLLDFTDNSAQSFLPILSYRPAPVQIAGIERLSLAGNGLIDCFLTDDVLSADDIDGNIREKLLHMPCRYSYAMRNDVPVPNGTPALEKRYITLGVFAKYRQINNDMLVLWRDIMEQISGARLLMNVEEFAEPAMVAEASERMSALGFDMERVDLEGSIGDRMTKYLDVDILLGTYPAMDIIRMLDAMYMGVPVISMYGQRRDTRSGLSILKRTGMENFVAACPAEYLEKTVSLAGHIEELNVLHKDLRTRLEAVKELRPVKWARKLETRIRELVYM